MNGEGRMRIAAMLERDKEDLNAESRAQAERDFFRVAREYFEMEDGVHLVVERERTGFRVTLQFHAGRVKNFSPVK